MPEPETKVDAAIEAAKDAVETAAEAVEDAREEAAEQIEKADDLSRWDALENRLGEMDRQSQEFQAGVLERLDNLTAPVAEPLTEAIEDVPEVLPDPAEDIVDTVTEPLIEPAAETLSKVEEATQIEEAPARVHRLFRKLF